MVRTLMAAALAVFVVAAPAAAQAPKFGLIGGANLTHIDITDAPGIASTDVYIGQVVPSAGVVVTSQILDRLAIRMDLAWVQKGQTAAESLFGVPATLDLSYFEIPLMGVFDLTGGRFRPYIVGGPSLGLLLGAYISALDPQSGDYLSTDYKDAFRSVDFSVTGGAGLAWVTRLSRVFIETRYSKGLTDIENNVNRGMKTSGLQILIGVSAR
jgi:hypothetical protein